MGRRSAREAERSGIELSGTGSWFKSSYSGPTGGNCVEVALAGRGRVAVRDSRQPSGPALVFAAAQWDAFIASAKGGEFG